MKVHWNWEAIRKFQTQEAQFTDLEPTIGGCEGHRAGDVRFWCCCSYIISYIIFERPFVLFLLSQKVLNWLTTKQQTPPRLNFFNQFKHWSLIRTAAAATSTAESPSLRQLLVLQKFSSSQQNPPIHGGGGEREGGEGTSSSASPY